MADVEKEILIKIATQSAVSDQLKADVAAFEKAEQDMLDSINAIADQKKKLAALELFNAGAEERKLKAFGEAIENNLTQPSQKARSATDDLVERLNILGDRGSALVGEINKISDPLKRVELAQKALSSSSFQSGGALGKLGERFQTLKVSLATTVGGIENLNLLFGLGVGAIGLLATAIGTVLVAAYERVSAGIDKYIEKNKEAAASDNFAKQAAESRAAELGGAAFDFANSFDFAEARIQRFTDNYLKNTVEIISGTKAAGDSLHDLYNIPLPKDSFFFKFFTFGHTLLTGGVATQLPGKALKKFFDYVGSPIKEAKTATDAYSDALKRQKNNVNELAFALKGYAAGLEEIVRLSYKPTPLLDAISSFKSTGDSRTLAKNPLGKDLGGGPKKQEAVAISFSDTATNTLKEIFNNLAIKIGGQISSTPLALQGAQATAGAVQDTRGQQLGSALAAAQGGVGKGLDTGLSTATDQAKAFDDQVNNLKGSFLSLGVGITDAFLAFSVGAQTGKQVLQGVLSNVGSLAAQLGTFFILLGGAESSTGFLGLKGTAAIAAGASLLAFGAGLKAGAASVGVSATNETKSRRQSVIKAPNANNLPQAQTSNLTVILEVEGDKFVKSVAPSFERASRRGAIRIDANSISRG